MHEATASSPRLIVQDSDAQVRTEEDADSGQAPLLQLIRTGLSGAAAAQEVGVSLSCGSLWFIDAGRVSFIETQISPRFLSQDDRIEIADGLAHGKPVKLIAARIGKTYQSVYREIARNRKPDGRYQPWYAHNRAYQRRRRPKPRRFTVDAELAETVAGKLGKALVTSPDQPVAAAPLPAPGSWHNLIIERVRRLAHGFRDFTHERLRILRTASGNSPYRK